MRISASIVPADGTQMVETLRHGISVERARRDTDSFRTINHYHDYYELYYLVSGERRFFIQDKTYDLVKGALVLIPPYTIHRTLTLSSPSHERILVSFRGQAMEEILGDDSLLSNLHARRAVYRLPLPHRYKLEDLLGRMLAEFTGIDAYSKRLCPVLLCELAAMIHRLPDQASIPGDIQLGETQLKFHAMAKYISENYTERITLDHLSEKFFLSPYHLCRKFKQITGFRIVEYLNNIRIIEAQHILREGDIRVAELAGRVGFENISHFQRMFKRITGTAPLQYKKKFVKLEARASQ